MKYEKKFYTLSEAAEELFVSENDLTLEAAAGRLLVCFFYRGHLGIYSKQKEQQKPVCHFDGYLRSLERVSLRRKSEKHTEFESTYTTADECRARIVNVALNLTNKSAPPALTDNQYYTRLDPDGWQKNSHVDESEWHFHIDDLRALKITNSESTDQSKRESETIKKKDALVTESKDFWLSIEADISDAVRNGLHAVAKHHDHGYWKVEPALNWANQRGKLNKTKAKSFIESNDENATASMLRILLKL